MKMEPNQRMAEDLAARLGAAGIRGRVEGGGVHWQVDAGPVGTRSVVLHCFWYDRAFSGLMLGINLANARSRLRAERAPHEGPEYLVVVRDDDDDVADGRTHDVTEAVGGARSWLAGAARDALAREAPFIDHKGRAMRAIAAQINPALRVATGRDPGYEVFVHGERRACTLAPEDGGRVSCAFLIGQAQVARAAHRHALRSAARRASDRSDAGRIAHRAPLRLCVPRLTAPAVA